MNSVANWTNLEITALFLFGYAVALIVGFAWGYSSRPTAPNGETR